MKQILAIFIALQVTTASAELPKNIIPLPIVSQVTDYSCGAASLLSVLMYWGKYFKPEETLHQILGTTSSNGTSPTGLVKGAHTFGLHWRLSLETSIDTLRRMTAKGIPAIVGFQAWRNDEDTTTPWNQIWHSGHYAVVIGVDHEYVYLQDPSLGNVTNKMAYGKIPIAEFIERWHDEDSFDETRPEISTRHHGLALFIWDPGAEPWTGLSCAKALEPIR